MKSNVLIHVIAITTLLFGLWLFVETPEDEAIVTGQPVGSSEIDAAVQKPYAEPAVPTASKSESPLSIQPGLGEKPESKPSTNKEPLAEQRTAVNPDIVVSDYIMAWRNKDKAAIDSLWETISNCDKCLLQLVDMIVNKNLEEGMMLELAIKMAALDTDLVLPVFDALIDPAGNRSAAVILSEKLMINGRPELVSKIFDIIYKAQQNGHENFAWQLTWVISKLENPAGIQPILDTVSGRIAAGPGYAEHVTNIFGKVVHNIPDSESVADMMASYYQGATAAEQERLWEVVSKHENTLVMLAATAERNGQHYELQRYANAIAQLPNLQAVDGLVKLHINVEYSPDYLGNLLAENVKSNPTIKVLHKLEDYMRNPDVPIDSRIFAAEGLLAVRSNRQARYILEKVINNPQYADPELQAYIGGRL
ncbi:hypothetical protein [Kaarinaea lacus]